MIVTDAGVLQALDANTGKTNWVTQFGNPNYPSVGPDANDKFVAVINGSTLYLLDRASGRIQGERRSAGYRVPARPSARTMCSCRRSTDSSKAIRSI